MYKNKKCGIINYMEKNRNETINPELKEKKEIELENKILSILLPAVGLTALIIGLLGFISAIADPKGVGAAIFLLILAILGAGGIAYGAFVFIKTKRNKYRKEETVPSDEPNKRQA